ncbi:hypothetical protein ACWDYJ_19300 [Streptomyces sp. NPDC003042]
MPSASHAAHLRQKRAEVDTGLLETDELAGHHRPVRPRHQLGQDVVAQDAAQLVGRPARRHLGGVLAELLLLAREALLGSAAYGVGDGHHQPVGHRGGLRGLPEGFGERIGLGRVRHRRGLPRSGVSAYGTGPAGQDPGAAGPVHQ